MRASGSTTAKARRTAKRAPEAPSRDVYQAPAANHPSLRARRVLNIPLLACPVAAGANVLAQVIGVGRFFMTVPATSSRLSAEFAGIAPAASLSGVVELQR